MILDISAAATHVASNSFGFAVSVLNSADGTPITDLKSKNFVVTALQVPSNWRKNKKLALARVIEHADGVYSFATKSSTDMQHKGRYALLVAMTGYKG